MSCSSTEDRINKKVQEFVKDEFEKTKSELEFLSVEYLDTVTSHNILQMKINSLSNDIKDEEKGIKSDSSFMYLYGIWDDYYNGEVNSYKKSIENHLTNIQDLENGIALIRDSLKTEENIPVFYECIYRGIVKNEKMDKKMAVQFNLKYLIEKDSIVINESSAKRFI